MLIDSTPGQLFQQAQTTTLTVSIRPGIELTTTPSATRIQSVDQSGQLQLDLEPPHILEAVAWVLERVNAGEVDNYTLAPASLESLYERITDDC